MKFLSSPRSGLSPPVGDRRGYRDHFRFLVTTLLCMPRFPDGKTHRNAGFVRQIQVLAALYVILCRRAGMQDIFFLECVHKAGTAAH